MKLKVFIAICTLLAWLIGCAYEDPHVYFLRNLELRVGTKLHDKEWVQRSASKKTIGLDNGNFEYRFSNYQGRCVEIYEVNPKTDTIIRASFEGSKKDCVQLP